MKFTTEQISKITEITQDEKFYSEIENAKTAEDVQAVFERFGLQFTIDEVNSIMNPDINEVNATLDKFTGLRELTEDELDDVVGGSFWSVFKNVVGFVPIVGTAAKLVCDLADGSLTGAGNIAARVGLTLAVGMFDAVATLATGGLLTVAKTAFTSGISAVGGKLAVFAGVTALKGGTSMAVSNL